MLMTCLEPFRQLQAAAVPPEKFYKNFKKLNVNAYVLTDIYDKFSSTFSLYFLGILILLSTTYQFTGEQIDCTIPRHLIAHRGYIRYVCWQSSLYYVGFNKPLPNRYDTTRVSIKYYAWVPFILLSMLALFYLPGSMWRRAYNQFKNYNSVFTYGKYFRSAQRHQPMFVYSIGRMPGTHLTVIYLLMKILSIITVICQFFLLNRFIHDRFIVWPLHGICSWGGLKHTNDASEPFPSIGMCGIDIAALGSNRHYSLQCALPTNTFYKLMFLSIWFWLCLVFVVSIIGLIKFLFGFTADSRKKFIFKFLSINKILPALPIPLIGELRRFDGLFDSYFCPDIILLLQLLEKDLDSVIVGDIICELLSEIHPANAPNAYQRNSVIYAAKRNAMSEENISIITFSEPDDTDNLSASIYGI